MHPLWFLLGLTSANRWPYLLWSGVFGYLLLPAAYLRHHNCHVRWCWRLGKHPVAGSAETVCRRHHPDLPDRAPKEIT